MICKVEDHTHAACFVKHPKHAILISQKVDAARSTVCPARSQRNTIFGGGRGLIGKLDDGSSQRSRGASAGERGETPWRHIRAFKDPQGVTWCVRPRKSSKPTLVPRRPIFLSPGPDPRDSRYPAKRRTMSRICSESPVKHVFVRMDVVTLLVSKRGQHADERFGPTHVPRCTVGYSQSFRLVVNDEEEHRVHILTLSTASRSAGLAAGSATSSSISVTISTRQSFSTCT